MLEKLSEESLLMVEFSVTAVVIFVLLLVDIP
jgi:hypothetical protein